jgi:hypothetical protein
MFGTAYGAVQNLTLVVAFARAHGQGTSNVSAVWNVAFDTGTGIGAVAVRALAAARHGRAGGAGRLRRLNRGAPAFSGHVLDPAC